MDEKTLAQLKAQAELNETARLSSLTDQQLEEEMSRETKVERMGKFLTNFRQAFWNTEGIIASTLKGSADINFIDYMSYAAEARIDIQLPGRSDRQIYANLQAELRLDTDTIELAGKYATASNPTTTLPFSRTYNLVNLSAKQIEQDLGNLLKELMA